MKNSAATKNSKLKTQGSSLAPSGFFALRTPLLPFDEFLTWSEGLEAPSALADPARLEQALGCDRVRLRARLQTAVSRPEVREALFIASPDLDEFFELWRREPESKRGQRVELALVRYFERMASRATPFGLFAGASVGSLGQQTRLVIEGREAYQRHSRLDMDYLGLLIDALQRDPARQPLFTYRPNSSLYRAAGRVRYVESRLDGKTRSYHLVAVNETEYLTATLARAEQGATLATLAAALVDDEISLTDAEGYIRELIENQILVPDIALHVTGPEPIHPLIDRLRECEETTLVAELLAQTRQELAEIDYAGLGIEPERYRALAQRLETLPAKVELPRLLQVDLIKSAREATLGQAVLDEITRGVELLHRLSPPLGHTTLTRFREAFTARYEQREVPLVEALDEEIGVGLGLADEIAPLLQGLAFPPKDEDRRLGDARQALLWRKLIAALPPGALEIALELNELEALCQSKPLPLPDGVVVQATLAAASQAALDEGDFRVFLDGVSGPSGAQMFGRFCHADEILDQAVRRHLRAEEAWQPGAIFAEIVHLPEGRVGNVLSRPVLRDYEIPYLGCSGAEPERQIPITDLLVSVQGERIRLRSARHGREVIPRLTNAHNFAWSSLGVYRFLCLLQHQAAATGLSWNWGALSSAPFLPRVTAGRLVLSLARWLLSQEELKALGAHQGTALFQAVQDLRAQRQLPRLVALADGDNVLPIDLDNVLSIESFIHLVKQREAAILIEVFPSPEELCASGPEGRFVHELVVPFMRNADCGQRSALNWIVELKDKRAAVNSSLKTATQRSAIRHQLPNNPQSNSTHCVDRNPQSIRRFPPGSEWLYAKLYTGAATADQVVREVIVPLTEEAMQRGAADRWFFIRYSDPDWHVRLRFHGDAQRLHAEVLPALYRAVAPLLEDGRLWRVQLDTYEREVERYGGVEGIELAERIFHADSEAVREIIEMLEPGDAGLDERWRLTVRGMDYLLDDFGFDLKMKHALSQQARQDFAREFRADEQFIAHLGDRFRKERRSLEMLLDPARDEESPLSSGLAVLRGRSERLSPIIAELKAAERNRCISISLPQLALSHLHMHANRLLRSAQREQEMVIYDYLARLYESQVARARKMAGPQLIEVCS